MLTAVRPATDDSFVSEANVPFPFSPAPADSQTRARGPAIPHVPFPADRTVHLWDIFGTSATLHVICDVIGIVQYLFLKIQDDSHVFCTVHFLVIWEQINKKNTEWHSWH